MITLKEALDYEIKANPVFSFISWNWLQNIAVQYLVWKVKRKYKTYLYWTNFNSKIPCEG